MVKSSSDGETSLHDESATSSSLSKPIPVGSQPSTEIDKCPVNDERDNKIAFRCSLCDHFEMVHYFGCTPSFTIGIQFNEPTYIIRDPFRPSPAIRTKSNGDLVTLPTPEYFVAIGSHCHKCNQIVCKDGDCSFYYTRTYCMPCARLAAPTFPAEVQTKFLKQIIT